MQHLIYTGIQRLTADLPAITKVTLDVDGKLTELGTVRRSKSEATYTAILANGTTLSNNHLTKKQAGGGLKKSHDGKMPASSVDPVETVTPAIDPEQEKKNKRNARRRELRRLAKLKA